MRNLICLATLFVIHLTSWSQSEDPAFSVRAGVLLTSTTAYQINNADTSYANQLAYAPTVSLLHRSGLALDYVPYFISSGSQSGIYMHTLTLGYENYDGPLFTIRTGYTHYFFTNNALIPFSPISNKLYLATDYRKTWLCPALSLGAGIGKDESGRTVADVNGGIGLKHGFDVEKAGPFTSIDLSPSLFINGGTNQYFSFLTSSKYISRNSKSAAAIVKNNRKKNNGGGNTGSSSTGSTGTQFRLSNIELGWYSDFELHHVHIKPQGSVFFPLQSGDHTSGYWQVNLEYYF